MEAEVEQLHGVGVSGIESPVGLLPTGLILLAAIKGRIRDWWLIEHPYQALNNVVNIGEVAHQLVVIKNLH